MPISIFNNNVTYDEWRIEELPGSTYIYYPEDDEPCEVRPVMQIYISDLEGMDIEQVLAACDDYDVCGETDDGFNYIFFKRVNNGTYN